MSPSLNEHPKYVQILREAAFMIAMRAGFDTRYYIISPHVLSLPTHVMTLNTHSSR